MLDTTYTLFTEKKIGYGEDAEPIATQHFSSVFDGLGGAGYIQHENNVFGTKTSAYIGSRLIRNFFIEKFTEVEKNKFFEEFDKCYGDKEIEKFFDNYGFNLANELCAYIEIWCMNEKLSINVPESQSVLFLPSTMASVIHRENDHYVDLISMWSGDSRCFLFTENGLQQISSDDIEGTPSYYDLIKDDDSPMTNQINMSPKGFSLNFRYVKVDKPLVSITATDGCFMYFSEPLLFEYRLLLCFTKANTLNEGVEMLKDYLIKTSHDDCSMTINVFGVDSYNDFKMLIKKRMNKFNELYVSSWRKRDEFHKLDKEINALKERQLYDSYQVLIKCDCFMEFIWSEIMSPSPDGLFDDLILFDELRQFLYSNDGKNTKDEINNDIINQKDRIASIVESTKIVFLDSWHIIRLAYSFNKSKRKSKRLYSRIISIKNDINKLNRKQTVDISRHEDLEKNFLARNGGNTVDEKKRIEILTQQIAIFKKIKEYNNHILKKLIKVDKINLHLTRENERLIILDGQEPDILSINFLEDKSEGGRFHIDNIETFTRDVISGLHEDYVVANKTLVGLECQFDEYVLNLKKRYESFFWKTHGENFSEHIVSELWEKVRLSIDAKEGKAYDEIVSDIKDKENVKDGLANEIDSSEYQWEIYRIDYEKYLEHSQTTTKVVNSEILLKANNLTESGDLIVPLDNCCNSIK